MLKIFGLGSFPSWDAALASRFCDEDPEAREALLWFRARLGESWKGWEESFHLATRFFNGFQGLAWEGVRLYRDLQILANAPNLEMVLRRGIGSNQWAQFTAAEMALTFCAPFHVADHPVEFLKNDQDTCPDARIEIAGRPVVIEFKGLHLTSELEKWQQFGAKVSQGLMRQDLDFTSFHIHFAPGALAHVDDIVSALVALHASGEPGWHELPHDGGQVALNPSRDRQRFEYPVSQKPDLERIVLKLRGWCTQLADLPFPTLLVVRASVFDVFHPGQNFETAGAIVTALTEELSTKRMISGMVVYDEPFMPALASVEQVTPDHRMVIGTTSRGFPRFALLVPNPAARVALNGAEMDAIVGPNMVW